MARFGHWTWDASSDQFVNVSEECAAIFGHSVEEFKVKCADSIAAIGLVHRDDRDRWTAARDHLREDALSIDIDYRVLRPDGSIAYVREIVEAVTTADGALFRGRVFVRDIADDSIDLAVVKSIHDIGKMMNKMTVQ